MDIKLKAKNPPNLKDKFEEEDWEFDDQVKNLLI